MNHIKSIFYPGVILFVVSAFFSCNQSSGNAVTKEDPVNNSKQINFIENDWHAALGKAKAGDKLVFLDISASWCGPCKMLQKYTFTDPAVADFFNANFINISVDGEKGVGPELAAQYNIEGYPTLIVADATGKSILYTVGYIPPEDLLAFAKDALKRKQTR